MAIIGCLSGETINTYRLGSKLIVDIIKSMACSSEEDALSMKSLILVGVEAASGFIADLDAAAATRSSSSVSKMKEISSVTFLLLSFSLLLSFLLLLLPGSLSSDRHAKKRVFSIFFHVVLISY